MDSFQNATEQNFYPGMKNKIRSKEHVINRNIAKFGSEMS